MDESKSNGNPQKKIAITKPPQLSTQKTLANLQYASLHGLNKEYVDRNTSFLNTTITIVENLMSKNNRSIANSTPQMLVDTVRHSLSEQVKKESRSAAQQSNYITNLKGITDQSRDMDLFRELYPIATPMFELFYEYEMVSGMIPEGYRCFEILKNSVLSADNFTKKYLIPRYDKTTLDERINRKDDASNVVGLIDGLIDEYDLNTKIEGYIEDGMKYGAKPVMIIPIDNTFRDSAKRILQAENASDIRGIISSNFTDGVTVNMENALGLDNAEWGDEVSTESSDTPAKPKQPRSNFAMSFENAFDGLLELYENQVSSATYEDSDDKDAFAAFEKAKLEKLKNIKNLKSKTSRKNDMKLIAKEVSDIVNRNVKFSISTEAMSCKVISKVSGQLKTTRRIKNRSSGKKSNLGIAMESGNFNGDADLLAEAVDELCCAVEGARFTVNDEAGWDMVTMKGANDNPNIRHKNVNLNEETSDPSKRETTGSVIVPLAPDLVVPISVHGDHIGYYIIERTGSDDLGSGVSSLLGYRPSNSLYSMGMAGHMYTGAGTMVGNDGAGVILKDMTDIPQASRDDGRRIDLLRSMLARAIAERVGNPDIVDDKAFNSIIYSLIKDNYVTKREVRITYVPAHMMVYYAHSINKDTGIGTSVFEKGLFFAHVYIASLITNLMIGIAKSADREQINVEVGVNKRIEQTVQKVMRTLQTKRASIDSIGNVDTIMKQLGTFQRYISLRNNGTPLVEMETIPGQQIDLDNSMMDKSLKSYINSFSVPHSALNFLDDAEYSKSVALQSGMFLIKVIDLQNPYQKCNSKLIRILMRNKYSDRILTADRAKENAAKSKADKQTVVLIDLNKIFLDLPAPNGLNVTNMSEQVQNVGTYADSIIEFLVPNGTKDEDVDQIKNLIKFGIMKKHLPNIPWDDYMEIADKAKVDYEKIKLAKEDPSSTDSSTIDNTSSGGADDFGGGDDDTGDLGGGDDFS